MQNFNSADLESSINQLSVNTVIFASVALLILVLLAMWAVKKRKAKIKFTIFVLIAVVVASTTATISGATIYLNVKSATGGPVHWHADVEYWACGNELELRDPTGFLSNKIGTPTLHEHNDKRIHLEGVPVVLPEDASLSKFMNVIGGDITKNTLVVPLNDNDDLFENNNDEEDGDGQAAPQPELLDPFIRTDQDGKVASFISGQKCGGEVSEVQVFAYSYDEASKTYRQTKLDDPAHYAITPESNVPPGDCIIFEFAPAKSRTEKLCKQYGVRDQFKCQRFGVTGSREICEIMEAR